MKTFKELIVDKKLANVIAKDESGNLSSLLPMTVVKAKTDSGTELTRDSYKPTSKQLLIINKTALVTKDADSGYVLTFQATNSINGKDKGIDRSRQAFSEKALNSMAKYAELNTIPFLLASEADWGDHTWKAVNVYGYCIKAYVLEGALFYDMFFPKNEVTEEALDRLFDGLVSKGSVGFSYMYEDLLCSSCMKSIFDEKCDHHPGEKDAKGKVVYLVIGDVSDNYEFSGVAVPCQEDAGSRRKGIDQEFATLMAETGETFTEDDFKLLMGLVKTVKQNNNSDDIGKIFNDTIEDNTRMNEAEKLAAEQAAKEAEDKAAKLAADEAEAKLAADKKAEADTSAVMSLLTKLAADMEAIKEANKPVVETNATPPSAPAAPEQKSELVVAMDSVKAELSAIKVELAAAKASLALAVTKDELKAVVDSTATKAELEAAKTVPASPTLTAEASKGSVEAKSVLSTSTDSFIQKLAD